MIVMTKRVGKFVVAVVAATTLTACGDDDGASASGGQPQVLAAFYPLAYVGEQVGGDAINTENLTQPGVEPHDLELTPRQVGDVVDADLVIYLDGFQPALDEAIEQNDPPVLEVSTVVPLELEAPENEQGEPAGDPHIWLDPTKVAALATAVAASLTEINPDRAADFQANAIELVTRLDELDSEYEEGLATCERREIVTSHASFGYLAARYDLEQIPISGLSPEEEPSPSRLAEIQNEVEEHGITTIFFETLISPDLAETIARDTGATTAVLDPIEGIEDTSQDDYFSVMRANLDALRGALSCS
jgi:zinc transport system substrate-binding protein